MALETIRIFISGRRVYRTLRLVGVASLSNARPRAESGAADMQSGEHSGLESLHPVGLDHAGQVADDQQSEQNQ
jgi:hypothetical protein